MRYLEKETFIPPSGKLPNDFREAFGKKAKISIAVEDETIDATDDSETRAVQLNGLAGNIKSFRKIKNPIQWQRKLRGEWESRGRK